MSISFQIIRLTFLGGAFGTLLRFGTGLFFGDLASLLVVNLLGAALIGWLNANPKFSEPAPGAFWKTGFAGGFTTMSGLATMLVLSAQASGVWMLLSGLAFLVLGVLLYQLTFSFFSKRFKS